jgi:hypothetical protein
MTSTVAAGGGTPATTMFNAGFDSSQILHTPLLMSGPQYFAPGVYCWGPTGFDYGPSAQGMFPGLASGDEIWPTLDWGLVLGQAVSANADVGCGSLGDAGGFAIGDFNGNGSCQWSKLVAIPPANVVAKSFRVAADGSLLLAVVYTGTINFGNGNLANAGTSSLGLARFDTTGNLVWAKGFGGAGSRFTLGSLDGDASGDMVITTGYSGTVDFGGGNLGSGTDTVIARFDASGNFKWNDPVTVGGTGKLLAGIGTCGVYVATNSPSVSFGGGAIAPGGAIGVAALGL